MRDPKETANRYALMFTKETDVVKPNIRSIKNAIIAVNEILFEYNTQTKWNECIPQKSFWKEVKVELIKMR